MASMLSFFFGNCTSTVPAATVASIFPSEPGKGISVPQACVTTTGDDAVLNIELQMVSFLMEENWFSLFSIQFCLCDAFLLCFTISLKLA